MTLRTGAVNTATDGGLDAYALAQLATQQTTNIAVGDHVKFDTFVGGEGTEIQVDTTSTYSNANATASIGRITLHGTPNGGLTYKLRFNAGYALFSGATGSIDFQFYDATNGALISGGTASLRNAADATAEMGTGVMETIFTPLQDTLVEVRITAVTALTRIGTTGSLFSTLFIQTL